LYFTGSDKFNIQFRKKALERGYTLNEHALTPVREGVPEVPLMADEKEIFAFLGMEYVPPEKRARL
jgi:DNA polymerase/3'-5' exonuclease PolX